MKTFASIKVLGWERNFNLFSSLSTGSWLITVVSISVLCSGVGVMMLLALTVERYISVCHPGRTQPLIGPPRLIVCLIPLLTFLIYLPNAFRYELKPCLLSPGGPLFYQREDNKRLLDSVIYSTYKVTKGSSYCSASPPTLTLTILWYIPLECRKRKINFRSYLYHYFSSPSIRIQKKHTAFVNIDWQLA